ncbi:MAG: hypothetical protein ACXW07_09735 [Nitrososphaeraceae archaeon]
MSTEIKLVITVSDAANIVIKNGKLTIELPTTIEENVDNIQYKKDHTTKQMLDNLHNDLLHECIKSRLDIGRQFEDS